MSENYSIVQSDRVLSEYASKWKLIDFKELIEDVSSGNKKLKKSEYLEKGDLPVVDQGQELISGYTDNEDAVEANPPYVVFGDHTRIFKEVNFRMALGADGVKLLKVREEYEEECDYKFIYYFLQSLDIPNTGYNRHYKYLKNVKIPLPSLSEQKSIVAKLDRAQRLIDIDQEMLTKYDELIQSVFLEMFGDPVTNPKGWEKQELGNLISDSRNGLYVKKDNYSEDEGIKMIHMSDAFYGYAKTDESKTVLISEEDVEKYKVDSNDLLIARRSLNIEGAAKPCLIPEGTEDVVFESSLIRITSEAKKLLPIYLYHFLSNERARKEYLNKFITVSTISGINQTNLKKVEVLVPPLDEQEKFKSTVKRIEEEMEELKDYTKKSEELFSSLVQGAFG